MQIQSRQDRPIIEELRHLKEIAEREHGLQSRSAKRLEEALASALEEDVARLAAQAH